MPNTDAGYIDSFFALMERSSCPFTDPFSRCRLAPFLDKSYPVRLLVLSIGRAGLHDTEEPSDDAITRKPSWDPETRNLIRHHLKTITGTGDCSAEVKSLILVLTVLSCIFEVRSKELLFAMPI